MDARFLGNINNKDFGTSYAGAVWDKNLLCPTLNTMQGGGRQPMIICEKWNEKNKRLFNKNGKNGVR